MAFDRSIVWTWWFSTVSHTTCRKCPCRMWIADMLVGQQVRVRIVLIFCYPFSVSMTHVPTGDVVLSLVRMYQFYRIPRKIPFYRNNLTLNAHRTVGVRSEVRNPARLAATILGLEVQYYIVCKNWLHMHQEVVGKASFSCVCKHGKSTCL